MREYYTSVQPKEDLMRVFLKYFTSILENKLILTLCHQLLTMYQKEDTRRHGQKTNASTLKCFRYFWHFKKYTILQQPAVKIIFTIANGNKKITIFTRETRLKSAKLRIIFCTAHLSIMKIFNQHFSFTPLCSLSWMGRFVHTFWMWPL